ncbi:MAG: type IV pilus assembly protein PilM [Egibacteraceae bacterium]
MATKIGLDIGSSAVRAVQLGTGGRGPLTVERIGQVLLPAGAVRDGEVAEPDLVVDALRQLWSRYKLKGRKVNLGLANQQVVVRQIDLPYLPEVELRASLPFQVQDHIPIPVEQAILDLHVLEHFQTEDGQQFSRILLVAAHRDMVQGFLDVLKRAKLGVQSVDLAPFALLRSLAATGVLDGQDGELLVDVGSSVTNIVVHRGGVPQFVRILLMGGNALTDALTNGLNVSREEAEELKAGLADGSLPQEQAEPAARLVADQAQRFVQEIRGSVDYYAAQAESVAIRRIILSGGASQLPHLADRLEQSLRMQVDHGHPMQELKIGQVGLEQDELVRAEPYLAVAVGLAAGAAE